MRYFLDTEFIEDGKTIELLSIGIVADDGREFYAENSEADFSRADDWVKENVIRHLWSQQKDKRSANAWSRDGGNGGLMPVGMIARMVRQFCDPEKHGTPEFWAYYADYDWVVFCQMFGRMIDIPKGFPMMCMDLKQIAVHKRVSKLPVQDETEHHALADARWNKKVFTTLESTPFPLMYLTAEVSH